MNFFEELLDSYDKLKKRTFKIRFDETVIGGVVIDDNKYNEVYEKTISLIKSQSSGMKPGDTKSIGNTPHGPLELIANKNGDIAVKGGKFAYSSGQKILSNGQITPTFSKESTSAKSLAGYLFPQELQGGQGGQPEGQPGEQPMPGQGQPGAVGGAPGMLLGVMPGQFIMASPYADPEIQNDFVEIEMYSKDMWENLSKTSKQAGNWGKSPKELGNYVYGERPQSLERQIANSTELFILDENGVAKPSNAPLSKELVKDTVRNLRNFIRLSSKQNLTDSEKVELGAMIGFSPAGQVIIFRHGSREEGLVFRDKSNFLKSYSRSLREKFNIDFRSFDLKKHSNADNAIKGTSLENLMPAMLAVENFVRTKNPAFANLAKELIAEIQAELPMLMELHGRWAKEYEEDLRAISLEESDLAEAVSTFFGDKSLKTMAAILKISKNSIKIRQPDFIVPVGKDIGIGNSTDVLEVWSADLDGSFTRATQGLLRQGYTMEEIQSTGKLEVVDAKVAFAGNPELLAKVAKSGLIKGKVAIHRVSLKNYDKLSDAKLGENYSHRLSAFFSKKFERPTEVKMFETTKAVLGFSDMDMVEVSKYQTKIDSLESNVREIPVDASVRTSTNKFVNANPLQDMCKHIVDDLREKSEYKDLIGDNEASKLVRLLEKTTIKGSEEAPERIKEALYRYLSNKKLLDDISKNKPEAKKYFAAKLFALGGSLNNGQTADFRSLEEGKAFVFDQNKVVSDALRSFLAGDGAWAVQSTGNNVKLVNSLNPKASISLQDEGHSQRTTGEYRRITRHKVVLSRGAIEAYNRSKLTAKKAVIESILKLQTELLELV